MRWVLVRTRDSGLYCPYVSQLSLVTMMLSHGPSHESRRAGESRAAESRVVTVTVTGQPGAGPGGVTRLRAAAGTVAVTVATQ